MKNPPLLPMACPRTGSRHWRQGTAIAVLLWAFAAPHVQAQSTTPALLTDTIYQSDPHEEVRKLLRQAKYAQALVLVEKGVANNPRDPQMRFWQGYLYEQLGQPDKAQPIYLALTQEYPELPEPYNNLGVLQAANGDYGSARESFEQALRANPKYAIAQENLGDMLLQLAREAYQRALQINPSQRSAARKIELLQPAAALSEKRP